MRGIAPTFWSLVLRRQWKRTRICNDKGQGRMQLGVTNRLLHGCWGRVVSIHAYLKVLEALTVLVRDGSQDCAIEPGRGVRGAGQGTWVEAGP